MRVTVACIMLLIATACLYFGNTLSALLIKQDASTWKYELLIASMTLVSVALIFGAGVLV